MDLELKQSKEFYTMAVELYKILNLKREMRSEDGKEYLNKKYSYYIKLCEGSNLLKRQMPTDMLTNIPEDLKDYTPNTSLASITPPNEVKIDNIYTQNSNTCLTTNDLADNQLYIDTKISNV